MSSLEAESWTWYALCWLVVLVRTISRRQLQGSFRKMQTDDLLMLLAMITDTVLAVSINIVATTSSNLINPDDDVVLTPDEIKSRIYGSKMVLVVEQMQIATVWLVKGCLLLMYQRLTMSLKQNLAVKIAAVYVTVGFVLMEILYFAVWCRPFNEYWAVPTDNEQCSAATHHLITNAVLNISSDILIISIPMPVFLQARLPTKKKAVLCGIFALGMFTILSAILNKYYSFTEPFGSQWTAWYVRESSTSIIVANLPFFWTLLQRTLGLRSFNAKSSNQFTSGAASRGFRSGYGRGTVRRVSITGNPNRAELGLSDSQEQIIGPHGIPLKIYQQTEVHVSSAYESDAKKIQATSMDFSDVFDTNRKEVGSSRTTTDDGTSLSDSDRGTVTAHQKA